MFGYYLSRICEEFPGRLPSEIMAEQQRLPEGLLDEILASRAYARAVADNESDPKGWQSSAMRTAAKEIELELAEEEMNGERSDDDYG